MGKVLRAYAGIAVIVFVSLASNLSLLEKGLRLLPELKGADGVSVYEDRFKQVKKILPKHGVIGYVSDTRVADIRFAGGETVKYYLAQYALCPLVLKYGEADTGAVGNFKDGVVLLKNDKR